ncbi:MAG: hypothetical protein N2483_00300 [Burkholderiaceae bacterium]|nr:hypothetical protein [Burkholderiaceae bacterium]
MSGALFLAGAAAMAAGVALHRQAAQENARLQALAEASRRELAALVGDGTSVTAALDRYRRLVASGVVGRAEPVALLEVVTTASRLAGLAAPVVEIAAAAQPEDHEEGGRARAFDLKVAWRGLHEEELLALAAQVAQRAPGLLQLRRCLLRRHPEGVGLAADCEFRWHVFEPAEESRSR